MSSDLYGLPVTTASRDALDTYDRGARALLGWRADALDLFQAAAGRDPSLALAHAGAAICLFLEERFAETREAGERARAASDGQSSRERSHVNAVTLWTAGKVDDAERAMLEHLDRWPRDMLVLQRLYFAWFWLGKFPEMRELVDRMAPHYPGDSFMLGMRAFALEEAGECDAAARTAEAALALNPRDAWAIHALAHALYEAASFERGITRLPRAIHPCARRLNWFHDHLLWHLALCHFAAGDYARASRMSRAVFERAPSSIAGDLHDSISLLWRLDMAGERVGERWQPFAAIARQRIGRTGLHFHVAHVAMALAGDRDWVAAEQQVGTLRARAPKDPTGVMAEVLIPLVDGLHAFARGDYRAVIDRIEPLRPRLIQLGGSRAQRDVFHDTLFEAAFRAGDAERAQRYLTERIARRPDRFWTSRAAAR
ncbi:MAG: tetratricopeptide repeat protein [Candidatus Rokuibacteriota bacterium]